MDIEKNTLCSRCRKIDLSYFLSCEDHLDCWPNGNLKDSHKTIELGSLDSLDLMKKRHAIGSYDCDLVWKEHGQGSTRADLSYFERLVEAMFWMDIVIWHHKYGKNWLGSPYLIDIFQPTPRPVPHLKPDDEPSQFWNTLRSNRLRSLICEPEVLRT